MPQPPPHPGLLPGSTSIKVVQAPVDDLPESDARTRASSSASTTSTTLGSDGIRLPSDGYPAASGLVNLGQGILWISCEMQTPNARDGMKAEVKKSFSAISAKVADAIRADLEEVADALNQAAEHGGSASSRSGRIQICCPEAMQELDFCTWNGDGHYRLNNFAGDHPPTLGQVMQFLQKLHIAQGQGAVTVFISSSNRRATGAVLAGAFLVLVCGLSAEEAWAKVLRASPAVSSNPKVAWDRFAPPFSSSGATSESSLAVQDCLSGLQFARNLGWVEDFRVFDVNSWRYVREKFDASWLIPGKILAMGNPQGTAQNPAFPNLLALGEPISPGLSSMSQASSTEHSPVSPYGKGSRSDSATDTPTGVGRLPSPASRCVEGWDFDDPSFPKVPSPSELGPPARHAEIQFQLSVEIPEGQARNIVPIRPGLPELTQLVTDSFASYLQRKGVGVVLRINHERECPEEKIYEEVFRASGLTLKSTPFDDGDIPTKAIVQSLNKLCRESKKSIAIHCMGGLGRTGVLIGAHAVSKYGIPGKAWHGWCRMSRAGTVQTLKQEAFLRSLMPMTPETAALTSPMGSFLGTLRSRVTSFSDMISSPGHSPPATSRSRKDG
mmetsp:Transcript_53288/g.95638  ORF Transcript_53288/g.95638 Transcript_53288/m.95638 type:complete len:611 (-) Transcript_53288:48-1880(-)